MVPSLHFSASSSMRACTAGSARNSTTRFATSGVKQCATGSSIFASPAVASSLACDTLVSFSCVYHSHYHNRRWPVQGHAVLARQCSSACSSGPGAPHTSWLLFYLCQRGLGLG